MLYIFAVFTLLNPNDYFESKIRQFSYWAVLSRSAIVEYVVNSGCNLKFAVQNLGVSHWDDCYRTYHCPLYWEDTHKTYQKLFFGMLMWKTSLWKNCSKAFCCDVCNFPFGALSSKNCIYFDLFLIFSPLTIFWSANIYVSHLFLSEQRGGRVEVFSVNLILRQWDMAVDLNWNLGFKFWSHSNLKEAKNTTAHYLEKCRDAGMSQFCHKLITGTFDKHIRDSSQLVIFSILAIYIC